MSGNAFAVITVVMETVMTANAYHGAKFYPKRHIS
ncbi:hypothetical protein G912_04931 [Escherichia coli UMEA 3122-1]|nr:hypothetical protein G702_04847 [Escherichia coli HVH 26 (4-5703913)]EQW74283.1 hypothetical protein G912_04931 [Escherichia coli UMEA 3122-1]OXZ64480.1 hypothetical protein RW74_04677 [Escherichia coli]OXZ65088.1 hypothetical protein RW76_04555 [Escherichia coli]OXZ79447.1 hypothetical protein RW77_04615 [Escherichia coli]